MVAVLVLLELGTWVAVLPAAEELASEEKQTLYLVLLH